MKRLFLIVATAVLSACLTSPVWAHVTVQPEEALAESFSKFVVRVPNERDDASTTKVAVKFPPLAFVSFADVEGWTRKVKMRTLNEPLEAFGESLDEVVGTVTWSGGAVGPGEFIELPFSAAMSAGETTLQFPAIQTYDSGDVVRWTGPEDGETPAAAVNTVELGKFQEEGLAELGTLHEVVHELEEMNTKVEELDVASAEPSGAAPQESSDTLPLVLGGAGVGLGFIALMVALTKRRA